MEDPDDGVGGDGAFFLLLDEPEVYGLPPGPGGRPPATCRGMWNTRRRRRRALAAGVAPPAGRR